jgi:RluA family pseudouridine synthase
VSAQTLYEDEALLAVDKPAGALVVRGREGEREPSLLDVLSRERGEKLYVVHRLDRGTSGVLLLARTAQAHRGLGARFERGEVEKRYLALVRGAPEADFSVDVALVPARRGKSRPAREGEPGKSARTRFEVLERLGRFALLAAAPENGRSHQIRVHLKYAGHPLAVDPLYGGNERLTRGDLGLEPPHQGTAGGTAFGRSIWLEPGEEALLARTPLHASRVRLVHPLTQAPLEIEAPLPQDFARLLDVLRAGG